MIHNVHGKLGSSLRGLELRMSEAPSDTVTMEHVQWERVVMRAHQLAIFKNTASSRNNTF